MKLARKATILFFLMTPLSLCGSAYAASSHVDVNCALAVNASLNQFEKDKVAYKVSEPTQEYIRKNFKTVECNAEGSLVGVMFSSSTSETSRDGSIYYRVNVDKNQIVETALFLP